MLNTLFPDVPWPTIRCVGFDLDGTLYDEFQFIEQVYRRIVSETTELWGDRESVQDFMLQRWLEKGSSYDRIFSEAWERFSRVGSSSSFVEKALAIFRNWQPVLYLPARNSALLDYFSNNFELFLISDGNPGLQQRKFDSLGLQKFFSVKRVVFTGTLGSGHAKPSAKSWDVLNLPCLPQETAFFGDRRLDHEFASGVGLHFQKVYNLCAP